MYHFRLTNIIAKAPTAATAAPPTRAAPIAPSVGKKSKPPFVSWKCGRKDSTFREESYYYWRLLT